MTANEALQFGFVAHVYKDVQEVWSRLNQIEDLPIGSILANKKLTRKFVVQELEEANLSECEGLSERFGSDEALMAMIKFQERRSNKSKL